MRALFRLLRSLRCSFPHVLLVYCASYLFLASFILHLEVHYFSPKGLSVFNVDFPNSFFPYPQTSFKLPNFSGISLKLLLCFFFTCAKSVANVSCIAGTLREAGNGKFHPVTETCPNTGSSSSCLKNGAAPEC